MRGRLSDPAWKSGPSHPEPTASEHAINPEPAGYDHDGVGVNEAERVDGEPLSAVREAYSCSRDGCDADPQRNHVYALTDVSERVQRIAEYVVRNEEWFDGVVRSLTDEHLVEFLAPRATIVDYDEGPILGFEVGEDTVSSNGSKRGSSEDSSDRDTIGYVYPHFTDESGFGGSCYGRVEPEPDINAHRYDL